jgi:hypothetical protein
MTFTIGWEPVCGCVFVDAHLSCPFGHVYYQYFMGHVRHIYRVVYFDIIHLLAFVI